MRTHKQRSVSGWLTVGGSVGLLVYLYLYAPTAPPMIREPWNPMWIPFSVFAGAVVVGLLLDELASRGLIGKRTLFAFIGFVAALFLYWVSSLPAGVAH